MSQTKHSLTVGTPQERDTGIVSLPVPRTGHAASSVAQQSTLCAIQYRQSAVGPGGCVPESETWVRALLLGGTARTWVPYRSLSHEKLNNDGIFRICLPAVIYKLVLRFSWISNL